jgi:beta-N-acetylhexosaminidase
MLPMIFGIAGASLSTAEQKFFLKYKPHGIILFSRNCHDKQQIIDLNHSIKSLIGKDVKILIDQEGGRVARIKPPISSHTYPNMSFFEEIYNTHGIDAARTEVKKNFFTLMSELKEFGIDVTCAPVCDLHYEGAHKVIGDRSFGNNVQLVIDLCTAALDGIHAAGGEGVIKHIPGHGRANVDSHLSLPTVTDELQDLEITDFAVFKALKNMCTYSMTAHVKYTCLDAENPVTTSEKAIDYIRSSIGFKNLIMTDDICMKALGASVQTRTLNCLKAGCDLILHCNGNIDEMHLVILGYNDYISQSNFQYHRP